MEDRIDVLVVDPELNTSESDFELDDLKLPIRRTIKGNNSHRNGSYHNSRYPKTCGKTERSVQLHFDIRKEESRQDLTGEIPYPGETLQRIKRRKMEQ